MLYNVFFGFNEEPFGVTPDPKFLYMSRRHEEALAHISFAVRESRGFAMLTGEIGSGKTTLMRHLLAGLDEKTRTSLVLNPKVEPLELLKMITGDFGVKYRVATYKNLMDKLNAFLLKCYERDEKAVLVIDEAQEMSAECMEFVRLLSNLETDTAKLIQVILVGQPELRDIVGGTRLRQLDQRIAVRYHLTALDLDDTARYIRHRLGVAGSGFIEFPRAVVSAIHRFSGGVPRLINLASDRTLMQAYSESSPKVLPKHARAAIGDLKGGPSAPAPRAGRLSYHLLAGLLLALLLLVIFARVFP